MDLTTFFGIDPARAAGADRHYFRFLDAWDGRVTFAVLTAAILLLIWAYRRQPARMPRWAKISAVILRSMVLIAGLLILWRPAVTFETVLREKAVLAVAVDKSLSMQTEDVMVVGQRLSRDRAAARVLDKIGGHPAIQDFELSCFAIGDHAREGSLLSVGAMHPGDRYSRLYDNAADLLRGFRGRRLAGLYIVTDGNRHGDTVNVESLADLVSGACSDCELVLIGAGSHTAAADIQIADVSAPRNVFVNESFEVISRYTLKGEVKVPLRFELLENGRPVTQKESQPETEGIIIFKYRPTAAGDVLLTVRAIPLEGEAILTNNARSQIIKTYEGQLKILYVEGSPRWEYRYLKNSILRDTMARLSCLLTSADPGFPQEGDLPIPSFPVGENLDQYDVIIVGQVPAAYFTDDEMRRIVQAVEAKGTGIVFVPGNAETAASYIGTPLEPLMPVEILQSGSYSVFEDQEARRAFRPEVSREGWEHPVMQFAEDSEENRRIWQQLPPLFRFVRTGKIKPGRTVLARYPAGAGLSRKSIIFASGFYGTGKVFWSAVDSTWRWRFQTGDRFFYRFWLNAFRYVSSGRFAGGREPCLMLTAKQAYVIGEQIPVKALVRDTEFKPVPQTAWGASILKPDGTALELTITAVPGRPGYFSGYFYPDAPGTYSLRMEDSRGNQREYQKLTIELPRGEFRNVMLNTAGMQTLADRAGGRVFGVTDIDGILAHIAARDVPPREEIQKLDIEVFNHFLLFLIITIGLGGEWALRRAYRLP